MADLGWKNTGTHRHRNANIKNYKMRMRYCFVCNAPIYNGKLCPECKKDLQQKKAKERTGEK